VEVVEVVLMALVQVAAGAVLVASYTHNQYHYLQQHFQWLLDLVVQRKLMV
jgi:hypothetical protein